MRSLTTRILFIALFIVVSLSTQAQRTWNSSFVEIGLGVRTLNKVPTDVFIKYDENAYRKADFGGGTPLAANLGFVFLPDQRGMAGKFAISGYLGSTSGFGIDIGGDIKLEMKNSLLPRCLKSNSIACLAESKAMRSIQRWCKEAIITHLVRQFLWAMV